jgi:hypothetical protein
LPAGSVINTTSAEGIAGAQRVDGPPVIFRERSKIAQLALKNRLPTSFAHREHVEAGGLMSYGPNFPDMSLPSSRIRS